jgi:hypothetical protein|tara:strand:+ start:302 stop:526 length:225 start_codon:yes stop_codon:yes gene_type:complete
MVMQNVEGEFERLIITFAGGLILGGSIIATTMDHYLEPKYAATIGDHLEITDSFGNTHDLERDKSAEGVWYNPN